MTKRAQTTTIAIEVTAREAAYLRVIAFNRFLDNIERALKGDRECKASLLAEDLQEVGVYITPLIRRIQDKI